MQRNKPFILKARQLRFFVVCIIFTVTTAVCAEPTGTENFDRLLDSFTVVDEIDTSTQEPIHEYPKNASQVAAVLGRKARVLPMTDEPKVMAWVIGRGKNLQAGTAYVLEIEFPDDMPRTIFVANRGADFIRGFATGAAVGDARQQFTQPSFESLSYPQSGKWQLYRTVFFLHHRFQGIYAQRDPAANGRPSTPPEGFHVLIFQTKRLNDPRSEGAAVGKIRLRRVPDAAALYADVEFPPAELPRRRVFFREEMADEAISGKEPEARGVEDPVNWFVYKARLSRMLGFNTFAKDLLEFGHNQGWTSEMAWVNPAKPPLAGLWERLVPQIASEGLDLLPYYEYKGALGYPAKSLGWERRAEKLYHGKQKDNQYTGVWWTEDSNVDLTDPDTLADAKKILDKTILAHKDKAHFAGAWFRTRDNCLPISFAAATITRFRAAFPNDAAAQSVSRDILIGSYEGDRALYERYVQWWFEQRAAFLGALREHVAKGLGDNSAQLFFTPWTSEAVPMLRLPASGQHGHPAQVTTDDPAWWDAFAKKQDGWFRWALAPTSLDDVVKGSYYGHSLEFRDLVSPLPWRHEPFHSAPHADPDRYRDRVGVMMTFPIGRLFTVAREDLFDRYRTQSGLTMVRHFTLNEDNHDRAKGKSDLPFDGQVGYVCVDVDRAGPHVRLLEARAVANGDPRNIGYLCGSSFSTGFPDYVRRFNQAFLAVPALPSTIVAGASKDREVVVREIKTPSQGTYYFVVNTSLNAKANVEVNFPAAGAVRDLVGRRDLANSSFTLDLHSGELRSYRVIPAKK